ncbi:hypothetical protein QBC37DRAFT_457477 [Rhypophila decipiens]|uniref:Uncharacterized protein n=1 Tax=Rhypophila decipiens TaxID=261697 RepID=A0AAN7B0W2_9PEZI|nr:hypothetical protein QBC37DRAFT_457477 [Rhypophila decipiens]
MSKTNICESVGDVPLYVPWGAELFEQVHHKEPDHLRKHDRAPPSFKEEYSLQQATPADEGAPPKQDLLYQAALAAAAQKAAAAGKFDRNTSPKLLAKLTTDSSESLRTSNINDTLNEYDPNTYDTDFDDNAIAEANASALASDSEGFYIQEFGLLYLE